MEEVCRQFVVEFQLRFPLSIKNIKISFQTIAIIKKMNKVLFNEIYVVAEQWFQFFYRDTQ